jgi:hypothetical protein
MVIAPLVFSTLVAGMAGHTARRQRFRQCRVTVTSKLHVEEFPASSVAVPVTVVVPTGNKEPLGGDAVTVGTGVTASVAVGAAYET